MKKNIDIGIYLQLIQEPINRMSTISSIIKGFCAATVAGTSGLSFQDINQWILSLTFLPIVAFLVMDIYYLSLEKRYRYLYNQVINGEHACDYKLDIVNFSDDENMKAANATVKDCIKSPSIWLFYPLMILIALIVVILKFKGVN